MITAHEVELIFKPNASVLFKKTLYISLISGSMPGLRIGKSILTIGHFSQRHLQPVQFSLALTTKTVTFAVVLRLGYKM